MKEWESLEQIEKEILQQHKKIEQEVVKIKGKEWLKKLREYLESCGLDLPIFCTWSIVDKPQGTVQEPDMEDDVMPPHKKEWVSQTTKGGYTGDDFAGDIYIELAKDNFLKIPYEC